jgi:hypothetical protein
MSKSKIWEDSRENYDAHMSILKLLRLLRKLEIWNKRHSVREDGSVEWHKPMKRVFWA